MLGSVFGMVGGAFAWCLAHAKTLAARLLPNPYVRIAVMGLMLSAILLAPILIGCEVFGFGNLPMFFIVCVVAYLFNMDKSIYALQERGVDRCPSRCSQPKTASHSEAVFRDTVSAWDAIRKARPVLSRRLGYAKCPGVTPRTRPQAEVATPCDRARRHIR